MISSHDSGYPGSTEYYCAEHESAGRTCEECIEKPLRTRIADLESIINAALIAHEFTPDKVGEILRHSRFTLLVGDEVWFGDKPYVRIRDGLPVSASVFASAKWEQIGAYIYKCVALQEAVFKQSDVNPREYQCVRGGVVGAEPPTCPNCARLGAFCSEHVCLMVGLSMPPQPCTFRKDHDGAHSFTSKKES